MYRARTFLSAQTFHADSLHIVYLNVIINIHNAMAGLDVFSRKSYLYEMFYKTRLVLCQIQVPIVLFYLDL